jgi:hypothetical protein
MDTERAVIGEPVIGEPVIGKGRGQMTDDSVQMTAKQKGSDQVIGDQ